MYYIPSYIRAFILCWGLIVNLATIGLVLGLSEDTENGTEDD